ncbi:hypothetical protein G9P44_004170 [Scheffersomyces stipitis]|nr:hypothetical protein G9P44_004170 [Scheffersomyces stipitis]
MTATTKKVVIIGGSFSAILAVKILVGSKKTNNINLDISVVSPSDKAYFVIATPRLLFESEKVDDTLYDLETTIKKYAKGTNHSTTYIKASAVDVDLGKQVVSLSSGSKINYDNLIVASGNRSEHPAFKLGNKTDASYTIESGKELAKSIRSAKSIAVIGGGSTGVELAGEIAYVYGQKKNIKLYTGSSQPLPSLSKSIGNKATKQLQDLNVEVINNRRAKNITKTSVEFNDGSVEKFDLVIPAFKYTPNSEFLPKDVLDKNGYVVTDKYFRLENYHNVIAVGDVISMGVKSLVDLMYFQKAGLENVINYEVFENSSTKLKEYKQPGIMLVVPISKKGGVGSVYGWSLPNFAVSFLKSKDYMISKSADSLS